MRSRSRIGWKLGIGAIVVLIAVFAATTWWNNRTDLSCAVEAARSASRMGTRAVVSALKHRMLADGDTHGIREMVGDIANSIAETSELALIAHDGTVVAASGGKTERVIEEAEMACAVCHALDSASIGLIATDFDAIGRLEDGERFVTVITPIKNRPSCATAACHAHGSVEADPVLGILQINVSLARVDARIASRNEKTALAALAAVVLTALAIAFIVNRLLHRPMRALTEGMTRLGEEPGFRLDLPGSGEFSGLADSFNAMADRLGRAFEELRDTRDYLEGIVESSADIIVAVNPKGYVYTFNRGAEAMLGYDRAEVIGRPVQKLFADPHEEARATKRLRGRENVVNYETRLKTKDGEVREVLLTLSRLKTPDGFTLGTFGIGKDLTDQKRLQERLVQAERLAAVGQAVAGIQHALKNMLNALKGGAYMVGVALSKDDRALLEEGWGMVEGGIKNLTTMSAHMLSYVRKGRPEFSRVDVGAMIREIETVVRPTAAEKGVTFLVDVPESTPEILCDGRLVHSAVMDILSNALDACRERAYEDEETPEVRIRAGVEDDGAGFVVAVTDNGCGMSPEVQANVFTPFFSTKRSLGTGLGLALTARTIRQHGGEIEVESEENRGTEFRIILPTDGPPTEEEAPDGQEGAGRR